MRSRFIGGCGRLQKHWLYFALTAAAVILILPANALAKGPKAANQLSVLGIGALLLFAAGVIALLLIVEKRDWSRDRHRALGIVVFIGLLSSVALIYHHHSFVLLPMIGCLLLIGGGYALYCGLWKQPLLEFWPWRQDMPHESDDERWDRRHREIAAHNANLLSHRLLYGSLTIVGLLGGTAMMAASNAQLIW